MKKLFFLLTIILFFSSYLKAQNEARIGIQFGVNNTTLNNSNDKAFGDLYPTFKPSYGINAAYRFTVGHVLPLGVVFDFNSTQLGQNYRGVYSDSSSYNAYRRLNYLRTGIGFEVSTNIRKQFSVTLTNGINVAFLTHYQDRYEWKKTNGDKYIMDINDNDVTIYDTAIVTGTLNNSLFAKNDKSFYSALTFNFLFSKKLVLGLMLRMDMGLNNVENSSEKFSMNLKTSPTSTLVNFYPYNKLMYRTPVSTTYERGDTKNQFMGVYLSLKYRIYNKDKVKFWYKEDKKRN